MAFQENPATAAITALHCVICFDEFDLHDQPPVVLPCGHTYVCAPCAKRIKVCMECREPLFWVPPRVERQSQQRITQPSRLPQRGFHPTRYSSLDSASPIRSPVKETAEPIPLPLPRNLVLLAMMEAAQRAINLQQDLSVAEEVELNRIVMSVEHLNGPCGTYAVKDLEGLAVMPLDPRKRNSSQEATEQQLDKREPFIIEYGQTIQISEVRDGVYKLARENGYIVASETQFVKVGGPLEKSCELEGMHGMVELRRLDLQRQLGEVDQLASGLLDRIQHEQGLLPTYPIISPAPLPIPENEVMTPKSPERDLTLSSSYSPVTPGQESGIHQLQNQGTPHTIDNSDLIMSAYVDGNARPRTVEYSCGFSFPLGGDDVSCVRSFDTLESRPRLYNNRTPSMAHAMAQPDIGSSVGGSSFDTVDFRTGLSGHRGLGSTKTPDRRDVVASRSEVRNLASNHRGIGVTPWSLSSMLGALQSNDDSATNQRNNTSGKRSPTANALPIFGAR